MVITNYKNYKEMCEYEWYATTIMLFSQPLSALKIH